MIGRTLSRGCLSRLTRGWTQCRYWRHCSPCSSSAALVRTGTPPAPRRRRACRNTGRSSEIRTPRSWRRAPAGRSTTGWRSAQSLSSRRCKATRCCAQSVATSSAMTSARTWVTCVALMRKATAMNCCCSGWEMSQQCCLQPVATLTADPVLTPRCKLVTSLGRLATSQGIRVEWVLLLYRSLATSCCCWGKETRRRRRRCLAPGAS